MRALDRFRRQWADVLVVTAITACLGGAWWLWWKDSPYLVRNIRRDVDDLERRVRALEQR